MRTQGQCADPVTDGDGRKHALLEVQAATAESELGWSLMVSTSLAAVANFFVHCECEPEAGCKMGVCVRPQLGDLPPDDPRP